MWDARSFPRKATGSTRVNLRVTASLGEEARLRVETNLSVDDPGEFRGGAFWITLSFWGTLPPIGEDAPRGCASSGPWEALLLCTSFCPISLALCVPWTTMAITGNAELGFDSGEGA